MDKQRLDEEVTDGIHLDIVFFYLHRRAVLLADLRPEISNPIHPLMKVDEKG